MKISGIYKIQSIVKPERFYIGSAVKISHRWSQHLHGLRHKKHANKKLQSHYNKYGESDLQFSVLTGCKVLELIDKEQFFIKSLNPWFNLSPNAGSQLGLRHSEKTRQKIKDALKNLPEEAKIERKRKQSESHKGKPNGCLGTKRSEESKAKMRLKATGNQNAKGYKHTPEARAKITKMNILNNHRPPSRKGVKDSDETRRRKSEGHIGINTWMKGTHPSEETIKKRSESLKAAWAKRKLLKSA